MFLLHREREREAGSNKFLDCIVQQVSLRPVALGKILVKFSEISILKVISIDI